MDVTLRKALYPPMRALPANLVKNAFEMGWKELVAQEIRLEKRRNTVSVVLTSLSLSTFPARGH